MGLVERKRKKRCRDIGEVSPGELEGRGGGHRTRADPLPKLSSGRAQPGHWARPTPAQGLTGQCEQQGPEWARMPASSLPSRHPSPLPQCPQPYLRSRPCCLPPSRLGPPPPSFSMGVFPAHSLGTRQQMRDAPQVPSWGSTPGLCAPKLSCSGNLEQDRGYQGGLPRGGGF